MPWQFILLGAVVVYLIWNHTHETGAALINVTPNDKLQKLAQGVNQAEHSGKPSRNNNPGDLRSTVTGLVQDFSSEEEGWQHLYNRLDYDFVSGQSLYYSPNMTFFEWGWMWVAGGKEGSVSPIAGDDPNQWARVVAGYVGVDPNSTVGDYLNG